MLSLPDIKSWLSGYLKKIQLDASILSYGFYYHANQLSIAIPSVDSASKIDSIRLISEHINNNKRFTMKLSQWREQLGLSKMSARWVLSKAHYQTLLIDRPDVKPNAYRAAVLSQAKDLLRYPIEDCVVDVFLPSEKIKIHNKKLYMVVAQKSFLTSIVNIFDQIETPIHSIITEEFALRNILYQLISDAVAGVLVKNSDDSYLFMVISDGDILFTRNIMDSVAFELYRSIEFYAITLKQNKLDSLFVVNVDSLTQSKINEYFVSNEYSITLQSIDKLYERYHLTQQQYHLPDLLAMGGVMEG